MNFRQLLPLFILVLASLVGLGFIGFWQVFFTFLVVLGLYSISLSSQHGTLSFSVLQGRVLVICCFLMLIGSRLFPFLFSSFPFGYDTGIYLMAFKKSFEALPEYVSDHFLGLPLFSNVLHLLGFSSFDLIWGVYVMLGLLLPLSVFLMARELLGRTHAIVILILFAVSLPQWYAYTFMFYKTLLALSFVALSFYLYARRSMLLFFPLLFLALLQPPDFLLLVLSLLVVLFWDIWIGEGKPFAFRFLIILIPAGALFYFLGPDTWSMGAELLYASFTVPESLDSSIKNGVFIGISSYVQLSFLFFLLASVVLPYFLRSAQLRILGVYYILLSLWVFSGAVFHERFVVELDFITLILAGSSFVFLFSPLLRDRLGKGIAVMILLGLGGIFFWGVLHFKPWISADELTRIRGYCSSLPEQAAIMAVDSLYAPWLYGFSCHPVIAPGMLGLDRWSYDEWQVFWAHHDKEALLALLEKYRGVDIYVHMGKRQHAQLKLNPDLFEHLEAELWHLKLPSQ